MAIHYKNEDGDRACVVITLSNLWNDDEPKVDNINKVTCEDCLNLCEDIPEED